MNLLSMVIIHLNIQCSQPFTSYLVCNHEIIKNASIQWPIRHVDEGTKKNVIRSAKVRDIISPMKNLDFTSG